MQKGGNDNGNDNTNLPGLSLAFWHIFIFIFSLTIISLFIVERFLSPFLEVWPWKCAALNAASRLTSAPPTTQRRVEWVVRWLCISMARRWWFSLSNPFCDVSLMIMILFGNYPLSFTEWKRAICAAIVPENGIISLLIMMTYDFHCQIC